MSLESRLPIALRSVAFGTGCALFAAACMWLPPLKLLDESLFDVCFQLRGVRSTNVRDKIVLIGIDDDFVRELNKPLAFISPELGEMVKILHREGARAIGVDLFVPGDLSNLAEMQPGGKGSAATLKEQIREFDNVVVIERVLGDRAEQPLPEWYARRLPERKPGELPTNLASAELMEDPDFLVRRQRLIAAAPESESETPVGRPHLTLSLAAIANQCLPRITPDEKVGLGDSILPCDYDQPLPINFVGPPGTFPIKPAGEILQTGLSETKAQELHKALHDKIALIGVTARGVRDQQLTRYSDRLWTFVPPSRADMMEGIELHANILATILDGKFLHRLAPWQEFLLLLGAAIALVALDVHLGLLRGAIAAVVILGAWELVGVGALAYWNLQLPLAAMLLVQGAALAAAAALRLHWLRRLLGSVNSRQIATVLQKSRGRLALRGEERIATIMFTDLRGFSTFCREQSPQTITKLLNTYYEAIIPIIERNGGTVNRCLGDGLLVFFNAPLNLEGHALHAVRAAVQMIRKVRSMESTWKTLGYPDLKMGVGINSGHVIVGLVGSRNRLDYTANGDVVNAAARIEAENKTHGTEILIGAATWKLLPHDERERLHCRPAGITVEVKGVGAVEMHVVDVPEVSTTIAGNNR